MFQERSRYLRIVSSSVVHFDMENLPKLVDLSNDADIEKADDVATAVSSSVANT